MSTTTKKRAPKTPKPEPVCLTEEDIARLMDLINEIAMTSRLSAVSLQNYGGEIAHLINKISATIKE